MGDVAVRAIGRLTTIRSVGRLSTLCAVLSVLLGSVLASPAHARYAAIVVDADTGTVLFSRNADDRNHPASLTKVMTLYMVFEALEKGKLKLDQRLPVSRRAAGQAPSKLGLKAGSTIRVRDAILALVTKSANDVATVVAEALGGSEIKFAKLMTARARALGMKDTTFRNASGLPNRAQLSTARDMVTLALAIQRDFPGYYDYFSTRSFKYGGKVYRNHNNLLGRYEGTNGIKTGYIRASGFNLVASVERNGQRLIGVVFGGRTAASRDAHMRTILDRSFVRVAELRTPPRPLAQKPEPPQQVASDAPVPRTQPTIVAALAEPVEPAAKPELQLSLAEPAPAADGPALIQSSLGQPEPSPAEAVSPAAPIAAATDRPASQSQPLPPPDAEQPRAPAAVAEAPAPVVARAAGQKNTLRLTATAPAVADVDDKLMTAAGPTVQEAAAEVSATGAWVAQVGAFQQYASARKRLQRSISLLPDRFKYRGTAIEPADDSGKRLFRARLIGLSEEDAQRACELLKRKRIGCLAIGPEQIAGARRGNQG